MDGTWDQSAKVAQKAEEVMYQDPSGALQHLRKFGTMMAKNIVVREGITLPERDTQLDRLKVLDEKGILPKEIKDYFHELRMTGNNAIYQDIGSVGKAVATLESAYFIAVWAYRKYNGTPINIVEFEIPQKKNNEAVIQNDDIKAKPKIIANVTVHTDIQNKTPNVTRMRARRTLNKPGDVNRNDQELLAKTEIHSESKPEQRIWIVRCKQCSNMYGVNGCDFHIRKCPLCQGGKPGEPRELWNHYMVTPEEEGTTKNQHTEKLTLHEAMIKVLSQADKKTVKASELADKVFNSGLYVKKDGNKALYKQVLLRAKNYPRLFTIMPGKMIKLIYQDDI